MSAARDDVLGAVAAAVSDRRDGIAPADRMTGHPAGVIPVRGRLGAKARTDLFIREAERVNATVARVSGPTGVPREVARYLSTNNLPTTLKIAPDVDEPAIPWSTQKMLTVGSGAADGTEAIGVSRAFAAVAETGTVVALSGPSSPTTLNFLPPTHIVVVAAADIAGDYEGVWAKVRKRAGADAKDGGGFMPRTVNWITGPSRTADIEQTLLLGAHGPQRLHIVIVDGEIPAP